MLHYDNFYHQQINSELRAIRSQLLERLRLSQLPNHRTMHAVLEVTEPSLWIEALLNKVGPEYQLLIGRLDTLEAAISQIEIGQYGYCCDCEKKIDEQTLKLDPAAQRCMSCQR